MSQRTSVSDGLARLMGRMVEDACRTYPGGKARMELVKGDPGFVTAFHALCDERSAIRGQTLAIIERLAWKTIKLGTHKSSDELRTALNADFRIGTWADDILTKTKVAPKPTEVDLVLVTVADLGFPDGAKRSEIYTKAVSLGLQICPAEVGPQLRLQYPDQPMGEWILVGMEPIVDSGGDPGVFHVGRPSDGRWLRSDYGDPGLVWRGDSRWVFCRK